MLHRFEETQDILRSLCGEYRAGIKVFRVYDATPERELGLVVTVYGATLGSDLWPGGRLIGWGTRLEILRAANTLLQAYLGRTR